MRTRVSSCSLGLASVLAVSTACGQAVQLPTFRQFSVSTTISVPDRGGMYLGNVNRASSASNSRGLPLLGRFPGAGRPARSRGFSRTTSSSSASVHATIIDHAEMDRRVLAEAAARRAVSGTYVGADAARRADFLSRNVGRSPSRLLPSEPTAAASATASVEELRRRNEAARGARASEAIAYYEKGRAALAGGKQGAAKVYFNMADRRADGDLKLRTQNALANLSGAANHSSLVSSE